MSIEHMLFSAPRRPRLPGLLGGVPPAGVVSVNGWRRRQRPSSPTSTWPARPATWSPSAAGSTSRRSSPPTVPAGPADRPETWLTADMRAAYRALHRAGVAHSVEVWAGDDLVGGLYGVLTGRVFAGESMFHRSSDASKVAVVDLCRRLAEAGVVMIDTRD